MAGRGITRWREVVVVAGLAVLIGLVVSVTVIAVGLRGRDLSTAANVAQLMSVALAVPPLAVALMIWRPRGVTEEQRQRAEVALRALVREQWRDEIRIRGLDDVTPLVVRWRLTELRNADDTGRLRRMLAWVAPGLFRFTGRTDEMDQIADRFRRLPRRCLVILGEPGMGKTTLAVLLLQELLEEPRPGEPVPVLLSMAGWNPEIEPVHRWLARRLHENYPALRAADFGADAPGALVAKRRILPVLDGLVGFSRWASTPVTDAQPQTPGVTLRRDLQLISVRSLAFGLMLGPAFGIAGAMAKGFTGLIAAVEAGVVFGIAGGGVFVLTFGFTGAGSVYLVAVTVLGVRRRLPLRLMRFLDDAHRLGLFRQEGPAFQFRYAQLQDRLAHRYDAAHAEPPGHPDTERR